MSWQFYRHRVSHYLNTWSVVAARARERINPSRLGLRQFRDARENLDEAGISSTIFCYLGSQCVHPFQHFVPSLTGMTHFTRNSIFLDDFVRSFIRVCARARARTYRPSAIFMQIDVNDEVAFERAIRKVSHGDENTGSRESSPFGMNSHSLRLAKSAIQRDDRVAGGAWHVPLFLFLSRSSSSSPA